jgi:alkaline phosphatase D
MAGRWILALCAFFLLGAAVAGCGEEERPHLTFTHGVASGDVTATGAILWTRVDGEGEVTAEVSLDEQFEDVVASEKSRAGAEHDLVVKAAIEGLDPGGSYFYRFLSPDGSASPIGTFRTAPAPDVASDVVFAYTGDSAAYLQPFTLLSTVREDDPDFFIYLGDTVIADPPELTGLPTATTLPEYRQLYKDNRDDEHLRDLMAATSTYAVWDDHEVVNDFDSETVDPDMLAAGRQAFIEYMPIRESPEDPNRMYRSFRWGRDAELFILDERQYRSAEVFCLDEEGNTLELPTLAGDEACQEALSDPARTFLGRDQMEWLKAALLSSQAKFKFIVSEVPISEFLFLPYDRWEGYPAEREELLNFLTENGIANVIFLVTDLHAAVVNTVEGGFKEIVTGPIARETLGQELEEIGVSTDVLEGLLPDIEYYDLNIYNYGLVRVLTSETPARVMIDIKDGDGNVLYTVEVPEQ